MAVKFGLSLNRILQRALPQVHNCKLLPCLQIRHIHINSLHFKNKEPNELIVRPSMFYVPEGDRNKDTFLEAVKIYTTRPGPRRAQVEFIYAALKEMEEFGVHRDLEAYKDIIDILPKGKYIPTNMFQAEFMHYPKQQQCIIDVLEQMENNGVCPDKETDQMVLNIFGRHGAPTKKLRRMAYWMPKFKNQSPWALPQKIPNSNLEIAKLAVQRMGSVDPATEMNIFQTSELQDAIDDTWIVNGQSANQRDLLAKLKEKQTVYVEGAFTIWLRRTSINYFILRSEPVPLTEEEQKQQNEYDYDDVSELRSWMFGEENLTRKDIVVQPSVHEQEDGTILAIAITGTCSKDSLLSWIRFLEKTNPNLANLSILFATNSPLGEVAPAIESNMPSQPLNKITGGSDL
ncbi:evolutionarily conserved signaling intermediate in Toll pathway, mitochondrial-like isoform X1 [Daphnia pulex]|uniref:evolutionarily conserved signaling intermediate in Toll pathway, mitochondrial-like isoform X1 n=2 Tax=Daphnia pulex TaxID=6669 RepID=UPI001EDE3AA6|nr:evolutionarily conserved signaling intermediate in Toll pathway, mitochondrial-like isoform X1 [Daphnia pulex]